MFVDFQSFSGSWGRNLVGNWVVALQCKTIHDFVKRLYESKFVGRGHSLNAWKLIPQWTMMIPQYFNWLHHDHVLMIIYNERNITFDWSSQVILPFFRLLIPFSCAYCCHFVSAFSFGTGFSLGIGVLGSGSYIHTIKKNPTFSTNIIKIVNRKS